MNKKSSLVKRIKDTIRGEFKASSFKLIELIALAIAHRKAKELPPCNIITRLLVISYFIFQGSSDTEKRNARTAIFVLAFGDDQSSILGKTEAEIVKNLIKASSSTKSADDQATGDKEKDDASLSAKTIAAKNAARLSKLQANAAKLEEQAKRLRLAELGIK